MKRKIGLNFDFIFYILIVSLRSSTMIRTVMCVGDIIGKIDLNIFFLLIKLISVFN